MARAALDMSTTQLAKLADVRAATINHFERGRDSYASTVAKVRTALEGAGIVFVSEGEASLGGGGGVRFNGPA